MTKIWGDYGVNQAIESFCKGDDSILDAKLLTYDIAATQAHITTLADLGVLSKSELKSLETELENLKFACTQTGFCIPPEYVAGII